ncbi:uncharacterized protein LOC121863364 [Homarus americanus]|uniref:uncharacterized protein LOC121863364 n=1 Tax=Homarus americanus TaxID=6706 RepID=UPI001C479B6A|nr:uncharacterized protein LOC121863364 [Homarus americanus]
MSPDPHQDTTSSVHIRLTRPPSPHTSRHLMLAGLHQDTHECVPPGPHQNTHTSPGPHQDTHTSSVCPHQNTTRPQAPADQDTHTSSRSPSHLQRPSGPHQDTHTSQVHITHPHVPPVCPPSHLLTSLSNPIKTSTIVTLARMSLHVPLQVHIKTPTRLQAHIKHTRTRLQVHIKTPTRPPGPSHNAHVPRLHQDAHTPCRLTQ